MSYHPTIWRTCRVLANARRLACLRAVLLSPGATVGEVAAAAKVPQDQASLCLRALQARGLLHSKRQSRWVRYDPTPDPLVPVAAPILAGISQAVLKERLPEEALIRCLTAFTHPRRLTLLRHLKEKAPMTFSNLARAGRMSETALFRHLKKLADRGLVREADEKWTLHPKPCPLAKVLLSVAAGYSEE